MEAAAVVKGEGKPNDLLERIKKDAAFKAIHDKLDAMLDPILFAGRSPQQVNEFLTECIDPILTSNKDLLSAENLDDVKV